MPLAPVLPRQPSSPSAIAAVEAFRAAGGEVASEPIRTVVGLLGEHAPALLPLLLGDPSVPGDVLRMGLARRARVAALLRQFNARTADLPDGPALRRELRRLRHRHVVRIALQEILRLADIDATSAEMSALAAAACESALGAARRAVEERFGPTRLDAAAQRADPGASTAFAGVALTCLGMGKLGGWELNLGSDVDLCFFYETDEAHVVGTAGSGSAPITVHEHCARAVSRAVAALSDVTDDGFCFRVDLRLRPEGSRGPLVNSLASAERYYESWGRTWERAALLRARPIAGDRELGRRLLETLRPFVFRRAVDPGIAREMAEMLDRARRELAVDEIRDVKLGRGGIREAEFFVQTLQLVWGGRHPQLQVPGTMQALQRLEGAGLVRESEARGLASAWARLRRVEHRIHVWSGYQSHRIPPEGEDRERFARSLGHTDADALERAIEADRAIVAELFASLVPDRPRPSARDRRLGELCDRIAHGIDARALAEEIAAAIPARDPHEAAAQLLRLARRADAPLGLVIRERHPSFGPRLLEEIAAVADPDAAIRGLAEFFGRLHGFAWESIALEDPRPLRRLVALFGTSPTLSSALIGHPDELDLLLVPGVIDVAAIDALHDELAGRIEGLDPEAAVSALRRIKREITLRAGLALAAGEMPLEACVQVLSRDAERQVGAALAIASREALGRYGAPAMRDGRRAAMVVIAMGKLGARELGFGGDLDLVFLYDEDGETEGARSITHAELFTRIAQGTMRVLSQPDAEGPGYATDTRLRPSGSQGTLVVSLAAFHRYHIEHGAPWERLALVRARPVAGDPSLAARTARDLAAIARAGPKMPALELAAMRARIQSELAAETADRYHPKLGFGGLVDVEFLAQWLLLDPAGSATHSGRETATHASTLEASTLAATHASTLEASHPSTLEALHALAAQGRLARLDAEALVEDFAFLRAIEQTLKLLAAAPGDPVLRPGTHSAEQVARRLGLRERDGHEPARVLDEQYRRVTEEIRGIFERLVAPVSAGAPWAGEKAT